TYDADGTRFALDGTPLILSSGVYIQSGAIYTTEINLGKTITTIGNGLDQGFVIVDYEGRILEYGTSDNSRSLSTDGQNIREWHLKYNYGVYGNCMTYKYNKIPEVLNGPVGTGDQGITYLGSIVYSSNKRDSAQAIANRSVNFFYTVQPDPVVVCGAGEILVMTHILSRIQTTIQIGSASFQTRAYNLSYSIFGAGGASHIASITEEGADGSSLSPTVIECFAPGASNKWYQEITPPVDLLGIQAADAANLSTKCYLAQSDYVDANGNKTLSWVSSINDDGHRILPPIANSSEPAYLPTDLNGDGRNDLVMAFDSGSSLKFSLSRCTGNRFAPYIIYDTPYDWQDGDSFFPIDCTGNGRIDLVHVATQGGEITLRLYFSTPTSDGNYTFGNIVKLETGDEAANTLQWFPTDVNGDGL
ncbi:hypothetical protein MMC13_007987, partial [Lambiella insularis]|nr:hypothetical protein [Lambiella insularis]